MLFTTLSLSIHLSVLKFGLFLPLRFYTEEVVPENLGVPLQGDRDAGELCRGASRVPSTVSTSNS